MNRKLNLGRLLPYPGKRFTKFHGLDLLRNAIFEAENNIQAPIEIIAATAVAAMSLAIQGRYEVVTPDGRSIPCSLYLMVIAAPGERKSAVAKTFMKAFKNVQKEYSLIYKEKLVAWRAECMVLDANIKSIQKSISKKAICDGGVEEELSKVLALEKSKPSVPKVFQCMFEDVTPAAMYGSLHANFCSGGLISAEGGAILQGRAMQDLFKANAIWSDDPIVVDRKSGGSYELNNARLTILLMIQESALREYLNKNGEASRGSGYWSRFLTFYPESTKGTRFSEGEKASSEYCDAFSERLSELLREGLVLLEDPSCTRKPVKLSSGAAELWIDTCNAIESEMGGGGRFEGISDYASKLGENIIRLAAVFHIFEGSGGDIPTSTLECAIDFCVKSSEDFEHIFVPPKQEVLDADNLDRWLDRYRDVGQPLISKNTVRQRCPNHLRSKSRLDAALEELYLQCRIGFTHKNNVAYIELG